MQKKASAEDGPGEICNQQPRFERRGTVLNVSHCMCNPARMPVVPNRNEFFALQKTRSQKMYKDVHFLTRWCSRL